MFPPSSRDGGCSGGGDASGVVLNCDALSENGPQPFKVGCFITRELDSLKRLEGSGGVALLDAIALSTYQQT